MKVEAVKDSQAESDNESEEIKSPTEKSAPCYGRELWDCLPVLERNAKERTLQMRSMKEMIECIR